MLLARLLVWGAIVLAGGAWAGTDTATAESLMRTSGIWEQLQDVAPQVRAGMLADIARGHRKPSETELGRLSRTVDAAYSAARLRSKCLAAIAKNLDRAQVGALRRWFDGPTGRAITRLEEALSKQADPRATLQQGVELLQQMPASRRRALQDVVLATSGAELMAELAISSALATEQGVASVSPNAARASPAELKAALEARRPQLIRHFSNVQLASSAVAYSSLTTSEIARYTDFLKSEAGRHFNSVVMRAFSAAMLEAATEFGRALPGSRDKAHT